jgi:hypothetical protein
MSIARVDGCAIRFKGRGAVLKPIAELDHKMLHRKCGHKPETHIEARNKTNAERKEMCIMSEEGDEKRGSEINRNEARPQPASDADAYKYYSTA